MKSTNETKIPSTDEAWDNRELGADEAYVGVVKASDLQVDAAAGTQLISIRLGVSMIEDLKLIANINGIGYQTLMKQVLGRFVECEKKAIWNQIVSKQLKVEPTRQEPRHRKVAGT
ncbi:CopG family antitoxin [Acidithiobacillus sp.]